MTFAPIKVARSNCNLRELCIPVGLTPEDLERIAEMVATRRHLKRRETLFRHGETFKSLYAIRAGVFKIRVTSPDGRDQVTGFQMAGEIIAWTGSSTATTAATPSRSKTPRCA